MNNSADIPDLVDTVSARFERILLNNHNHCRLTLDSSGFIKKELIRQIIAGVGERYGVLQLKAADAECADLYTDFSLIEEAVRGVIGAFFDETKRIVIGRIQGKIKLYEIAREEFKTAELRRRARETPLAKNRDRIERLQEAAG